MRKPLVASTAFLTLTALAVGFINQVHATRTSEKLPLISDRREKVFPDFFKQSTPFQFSAEECAAIRGAKEVSQDSKSMQVFLYDEKGEQKVDWSHFNAWVDCRYDLK